MNAQQLRASILQMAIEGRLVPQDPNDKPVEIDSKIIVPEEEQPFEIPENWRWVRLENLGQLQTGTTPSTKKKEYYGNDIPFIKPADIEQGIISYREDGLTLLGAKEGRTAPEGSVLMVCIGTIGKCGRIDRTVSFNQQINSITPYNSVDSFFISFALQSSFFQKSALAESSATTLSILNKKKWGNLIIPLPPLAEQKRIVTRIEELMPLVEAYGEAQEHLEKLDKELPNRMKQSILQTAIQGKLVPQDPNDKPVDIDAKDIVPEEEQPFVIPENWRFIRLGNLIKLRSGDGLSKKDFKKGEYPVYGGNGLTGYHNQFNVPENTIVIGRVGFYRGNVRKTNSKTWVTDNALIVSIPEEVDIDYMVYLLRALNLGKSTSQTAQPVVTGKIIKPIIASIPPLSEQKRIVDRVEKLFKEIDELTVSM